MLREMGFELNESKTHFIGNDNRQSVTGLVVNEKLSIPSGYKRDLRQEVYYALKFGVEDSVLHGHRSDFVEDGRPICCPTYMLHLMGKVQYVLQIEPENLWFKDAQEKLLAYIYEHYSESLSYYLHFNKNGKGKGMHEQSNPV